MYARTPLRIAIVAAATAVACSSDQKAGILLDVDVAANVDRATITSLAVTIDTRTQVYSPTSLPGSLGIRTSGGSHHVVVYGPAASPVARWEGTVVAVSSGTVPATRVVLETIATSYLVDGGGDALAGADGTSDGTSKNDGADDSDGMGGAGGTMDAGGVIGTGGSLGMDGASDGTGDAPLPENDGASPDLPGTGGLAATGGRRGSGGVTSAGGSIGTGGMSVRGGAGGLGAGGGGAGGRATGGGGAGGTATGGRSGTGGTNLGGTGHTGGAGSGGSSVRADAGTQGGSGGTADVVGRARVGVFSDGVWRIDSNDNGVWEPSTDSRVSYGAAGDTPVTGDWTGTGHVRLGVFRNGLWTFDENGDGVLGSNDPIATFGNAGDTPVTGAWTGTGRTLIGFYRNGDWYLDWDGDRTWNASIDKHYSFGGTEYLPFVGDWTGNGTTRIGVFKTDDPDLAFWTFDVDGNGTRTSSPDFAVSYGLGSDIPVPGPWGSTKQSQVGIFRDGLWNLDVDGDYVWNPAVDWSFTFGSAGDTPVVFVRP
jgi:hypothetical protein